MSISVGSRKGYCQAAPRGNQPQPFLIHNPAPLRHTIPHAFKLLNPVHIMDIPATTAIRALRAAKADFEPLPYDYVEHGGTRHAAQCLGVDEHLAVKTIVMETDSKKPFIVLMHGDREISTKKMARAIGVKSVAPCSPDTATRHTGYLVGGTSPFGTRKPLPVYAEESLFSLPEIYINGGRRGLLVKISPDVLDRVIHPTRVTAVTTG